MKSSRVVKVGQDCVPVTQLNIRSSASSTLRLVRRLSVHETHIFTCVFLFHTAQSRARASQANVFRLSVYAGCYTCNNSSSTCSVQRIQQRVLSAAAPPPKRLKPSSKWPACVVCNPRTPPIDRKPFRTGRRCPPSPSTTRRCHGRRLRRSPTSRVYRSRTHTRVHCVRARRRSYIERRARAAKVCFHFTRVRNSRYYRLQNCILHVYCRCVCVAIV